MTASYRVQPLDASVKEERVCSDRSHAAWVVNATIKAA